MNQDPPHLLRSFEQSNQTLRSELLNMALLARQNVERAVRALFEQDADLARMVIADDTEVDELERKVDHLGMEILVRYTPAARDLRLVLGSMRIAISLERISDHAVNIAKRARKAAGRQALPETRLLEPIAQMAINQLGDAIAAFTEQNGDLGQSIIPHDKELDRQYKKLVNDLSARLEEGGGLTEDYLHLIFAARSLERVGDLAVNIGEEAVFLETAKDIRHEKRLQKEHPPAPEPAPGEAS